MQESRNHIKTRMLRNAARAWGYPEAEAETAFDPLVSMLLSACSIELEKISGDIQASRARVLERLVQLLSPDVLTGAMPAHAVACALPVEPHFTLTADTQLYTHRKLSAATENEEPRWQDVFFTPTASFRLNRASVRFLATGNQLYRINHIISKEVVAHCDAGHELPASTLWLGIDGPGINLHESLFYFDLRNEAQASLFWHQLPKASWYINGQRLQHRPGYANPETSSKAADLHSIINQENDIAGTIKRHVNAFYKTAFITLLDEAGITTGGDKAAVPLAIANAFTGKEATLLHQQPLRWIEIRFPETISNRLLQDVVCTLNCFPVMNSRLHAVNHRAQEMINIVPLQTDDLFLDLEDVHNDDGKSYNFHESGTDGFTVLMRNGGVGRFDERDAATYIDYLLQLLRDDSAAFSSLGNDFINTELKQVQQGINKLEQRLFTRAPNRDQIPYLIIRNQEKRPWQNFLIRYWTTNGKEGNGIKGGTGLQVYKGGALEGNGALLVTTTRGGRNKLNTTESVLAYKSALLSKNRLITIEDIKAFCHYQLGERVQQVAVQKGLMLHPDTRQGFTRTIDITVEIHKHSFEEMQASGEVKFWTDNLRQLIEEKSAALMPYRVVLKEAA